MPLATGDLTPVPCRSKAPHPPLRYDSATRGPIAASVLPAGTYLGRLMPLPGKQVAAGEPLVLRSSIGPVTIERNVTAMQPGSSGKRLFVRDAFRGLGLGRRLTEQVLAAAAAAGYRRICLDTLPTLTSAIALYRSLGFSDIEPYNDNPVPGVLFLGLTLA